MMFHQRQVQLNHTSGTYAKCTEYMAHLYLLLLAPRHIRSVSYSIVDSCMRQATASQSHAGHLKLTDYLAYMQEEKQSVLLLMSSLSSLLSTQNRHTSTSRYLSELLVL